MKRSTLKAVGQCVRRHARLPTPGIIRAAAQNVRTSLPCGATCLIGVRHGCNLTPGKGARITGFPSRYYQKKFEFLPQALLFKRLRAAPGDRSE
jgi:hypothetical protein